MEAEPSSVKLWGDQMNRRLFLKAAVGFPLLGSLALAQSLGMTKDEIETMLELHNWARKEYGTPPLVWSDGLAIGAQQWAERLASNGLFEHGNSRYGENLSQAPDVGEAWWPWYQERDLYRPGAKFQDCGHYTQMVWGTTKRMGCGKAVIDGGQAIWVCRYDPAGNIAGKKP